MTGTKSSGGLYGAIMMNPEPRWSGVIWAIGGAYAAIAVVVAAYGAHAPIAPRAKELLTIAWQMQLIHALAHLAIAALILRRDGVARRLAKLASLLFAVGTGLFCGGLYLAAAGSNGAIAPIGGMALIFAWLLLGLAGSNLLRR